MAYDLIISDPADEMINRLTGYIAFHLNNPEAAAHLLDELEAVYLRLIENPWQFPESKDRYLYRKGYREALLSGMNYRIIFRIEESSVYIVGVFHTLEDYGKKTVRQ